MDNLGGNVTGNFLEELWSNEGFDHLQYLVESGDDSGLPGAVAGNGFGVHGNQLGLNYNPPQMNNHQQEVEVIHIHDNGSPPMLYHPISSQNSSGSESSTGVRTEHMNRVSDLLMAVSIAAHKDRIIEQSLVAMDELIKMAELGEPLWQRRGNTGTETLNGLQYLREFGSYDTSMEEIMRMVEVREPMNIPSFDHFPMEVPPPAPRFDFEPFSIEASRETGFVNMCPMKIVESLMCPEQWRATFSSIVARATLLGVVYDSIDGSYNGVLQVMTAEFHQSTPLISSRLSYFARFCKNIAYGTWVVVDVSLENLFSYPQVQFRRRPSGCVIQMIPHERTKITWVEHVEVDNRSLHPLFRPIVSSGFAFSAKRWIAMLNRHCQWLETSMSRSIPTIDGVLIPQAGRDSLLKLSARMTHNFFMNISSCTENLWMQPAPNAGTENLRFRYGTPLVVPGSSPANTVIFTTSVRIPVPVNILFDFLRDENSRNKWDVLSEGRLVRELAYVLNGENPKNRVSIMQVNSSPNTIEILYVQESFSEETGSYVVYAPLDTIAMNMILNGGNADLATILSSGFSILPDKTPGQGDGPVGSILTIAFHSAEGIPVIGFAPQVTIGIMDNVLATTAASIKDAIMADIFGMPFSRR